MPVEVLSEIFTFVIPYVLGDCDRKDMLDLSLVCRNWRNAVYLVHLLSFLEFLSLAESASHQKPVTDAVNMLSSPPIGKASVS